MIQGGISSFKSAAQTFTKKLDEIKEAISTSTTSTPVKVLAGDRLAAGDLPEGTDVESMDGSEMGERQRRISAELGSYRGSHANLKDFEELPDSFYQPPCDPPPDSDVNINLTSCSQCHNCLSLLYDEEIMSNWSAEDSNLNTVCQACNKPTVPLLTLNICQKGVPSCDRFSVPYLNPLVLRKETENILTAEGDLCLADPKFVEDHPIIYWNLVWAFERINVQTHLPSLCLKVKGNFTGSRDNLNIRVGQRGEPALEGGVESSNSMQPVEEGADPLTQELATQGRVFICV